MRHAQIRAGAEKGKAAPGHLNGTHAANASYVIRHSPANGVYRRLTNQSKLATHAAASRLKVNDNQALDNRTFLDLQRQYGNRYVQRIVDVAMSGNRQDALPDEKQNASNKLVDHATYVDGTLVQAAPLETSDLNKKQRYKLSPAKQLGRIQRASFDNSQPIKYIGDGEYASENFRNHRQGRSEKTPTIQRNDLAGAVKSSDGSLAVTKSPRNKIMKEGFESTVEICRRVLTSRKFNVKNGGVRVVLLVDELDKAIPNCRDFNFGITLTKSEDWWFDDEIATCKAATGGIRSFSIANLSSGTYYLTIWRTFDHPYCCLKGDILVFDEKVSGDSNGCERDKDMSVSEIIHEALDMAGFVPVLGAIPDGINALIYAAEGDWTNAGISAVAMVPAFGDGAKLAIKGGKEVVEASAKSVVKMGEEQLAANLKKVAAERASKEAAEKASKEAAEKAAKEASEKELKKKIAECEAIHASYKALGNCRSCKRDDTSVERATKIACITAVLVGRRKYLAEKCDYVLPGSIARGSAIAERGHRQQEAQFVKMLEKCSTLPTA